MDIRWTVKQTLDGWRWMMHAKDYDDLAETPWTAKPTDVARLLSISRSQAYHLIRIGQLPSIRVGNSLRVPLPELRRCIEARTVGGAAGHELVGGADHAAAPAPTKPPRRRRARHHG